jgi:tetratricopeptide (TPR) repeat protein
MKELATLLLTCTVVTGSWSIAAAPFVPQEDSRILERLPYTTDTLEIRELRQWHAELSRQPDNLELAVRLAWGYIAQGRAEADPRYYGYAQAALEPWWQQPPAPVLLLRATLRQNRHDFEGALTDLSAVLEAQPRNAQAWLSRAVILGVQGDYPNALRSCFPLPRLTTQLLASACIGSILSVNGQAQAGYRLLQDALNKSASADAREQLWALTILAETAARLGRLQAAERHFKEALKLGLRDVYLLNAYADFLLDRNRPEEVRTLFGDDTRPDPFLLRLALAEQQLGSSQAQVYREQLAARFQAIRLRGDATHLNTEARFMLHLLNRPAEALQLALRNWSTQREPVDARLVLEAALAADDPQAAKPVLDRLAQTGLEDVNVAELRQRLVGAQS